MEDYAALRRRNTLERVNVDLDFSVGFEPCRGRHHRRGDRDGQSRLAPAAA